MEPARDISRLIEIMAALRNPDGGCPWDLEQDFATIAPYTIEEAYEVSDAIERGDRIDLKEELGDLLLQVVYHSQMAKEAGWFTFEDVVEAITKKMIRRHPHVFGDAEARSAGSAKGQWERIKAAEKEEKAVERAKILGENAGQAGEGFLDKVPSAFPALTLALKIQKEAAKVGFDWSDPEPIFAKIEEEIGEFREALEAVGGGSDGAQTANSARPNGAPSEPETERRSLARREEELGDLVFSVVNLARFYDVDPEKALRGCVTKFRTRFHHIETALASEGKSLQDASLDEMEAHWIAAKTRGGQR
ncbi:nucleoside triphosphate pyrophosphohydrolase [Fulvimarina sp. MAC8]|uniref:nucleoside triphosphate pyrophosphohydrolase n=1 Tax=Fulvimarina sp. MAC8 TaxID=3162874 RepID=UPI0032EC4007